MTGTADVHAHALVLAMDYRVPDPGKVWPLLQKRKDALARLGAHHVLVYTSTEDHGRVMVTMALRSKEPILEVLRSRVFLDWFDAVGLEDIPAIFAGETVDKVTDRRDRPDTEPPGVIVAAITPVEDVPALIAGSARRWTASPRREFARSGSSRPSTTSTKPDPAGDRQRGRRQTAWVDHPDSAAEWMAGTGIGAYPPVFVGRLQHMMRIDENV